MDPLTQTIGVAALKGAVGPTLAKLIDKATGTVSERIKQWRAESSIQRLAEKLDQVRMVKTFWQFDKPVDLFDFYYPTQLEFDGHPKQVRKIDDIPTALNVIIQGTVGQGKSTFLRFLTIREALEGNLPLFVELRRLSSTQSLMSHLIDELGSLAADSDQELFAHLAETGLLRLLLDGFDEVPEDRRVRLVTEIEQLARRHPRLKLVITSRPDSGIERAAQLRVFKVAPLESSDVPHVVLRLCEDELTAAGVMKGLESGHPVWSLLTTPLMVALLVFHYRESQSIPTGHIAFFEHLFMLLLERHDRTKAGFKRERKSGIGDIDLERVFEAICLLVRKRGASSFTWRDMFEIATEALRLQSVQTSAQTLVADICSTTCLLLEEGGEYRFVHKIVPEYHAASFLARDRTGVTEKFYAAAQTKWRAWMQELEFLQVMDSYRFLKLFSLPQYDAVLGGSTIDAIDHVLRWTDVTFERRRQDDSYQWRITGLAVGGPKMPGGWVMLGDNARHSFDVFPQAELEDRANEPGWLAGSAGGSSIMLGDNARTSLDALRQAELKRRANEPGWLAGSAGIVEVPALSLATKGRAAHLLEAYALLVVERLHACREAARKVAGEQDQQAASIDF